MSQAANVGDDLPRLVVSARKYIDVKFRHMGRRPNALDCIGLGWLAYFDEGVVMPDVRHYGREPHRDRMSEMLELALGEPVGAGPDADVQVGDVVSFHYNGEPHHVAIIGRMPYGALSVLHADSVAGKVVEVRLDDLWRSRIVKVYRRPI